MSVTKASGDGGIDLIAHRNGRCFASQCKRYTSVVDINDVRAFAGVILANASTYAGGSS